MDGKVKWFNIKNHFGFIEGEDGKDYFVHMSALAPGTKLFENDQVSFEPVEGERGLQAQNVSKGEKTSSTTQEPEANKKIKEESEEESEEEVSKEEVSKEEVSKEEVSEDEKLPKKD